MQSMADRLLIMICSSVCYDAMGKIKRTTIQQDERYFSPHADSSIAPPNQGDDTYERTVLLDESIDLKTQVQAITNS